MSTNGLPFLPGHVFSDPLKTKFSKDQLLLYKQNTCIEKFKDLEPIDPYSLNSMKGLGLQTVTIPVYGKGFSPYRTAPGFHPNNSFTKQPRLDSYPRMVPQWMKYDKKVLRFYGYFQVYFIIITYY